MADEKGASQGSNGMNIDGDLVRQLAELLAESNLSEIEVVDGERKIRVARNLVAAPVAYAPAPLAAAPQAPAQATAPEAAPAPVSKGDPLKSPMVGTAYLAPNPEAANFVKVGDTVSAGQTLLIVEAMKVMNPIIAPRAGTVAAIHVENAQPVEFGQLLMDIA